MKRLVVTAGCIFALAAVTAGCSPSESSSPDSSASSSATSTSSDGAEASGSPQGDSSVTPPSRETLDDADMLRLSVSRFESELVRVGGAAFKIRAADNEKPDTLEIDSAGNERREWTTEDGEPAAVYTLVGKGVYTSKTGLDSTGIELMDAVSPDATWMLDSFNANNYVPLTPARVLEATLAYADGITCEKESKEMTCTITATGMSSMPGLGSFEAPEGGVEVVVKLNNSGDIINMVIFPNNEDFKLALEDIAFKKVNIVAPEGQTIDYDELVAEQQSRESENPSNESE